MTTERERAIEHAKAIIEAPSRSMAKRLAITHETDLARALLSEVHTHELEKANRHCWQTRAERAEAARDEFLKQRDGYRVDRDALRAEVERLRGEAILQQVHYSDKLKELKAQSQADCAVMRDALEAVAPSWLPSAIRDKRRKAGEVMKTAIFLLLPATALLYYPMFIEEFETPKAMALVAFACFALVFVNWRQVLRDRVAACLLLVTISAAASTVISMDKQMSIFGNFRSPCGLLVFASYLVLYLAGDAVKDHAETVFDIVIGLSVLVSGYALFQVSGHDFKVWCGALNSNGYIRPMSFMGHPNFMAEYLAMTLPLMLWRIDQNWRRLYRFGYGLVATMSGAAIFFSQSRGMWLASFAGVGVYFTLSKHKPRQILKTAMVTLMLVSASLVSFPIVRRTAMERVERIGTLEAGRQEYLKAAIRIWERHPILGVGTDAYELGFQHQRTPYYWQIEAAGSPHKAHNDFLNTLATQGIFGALAAILLTVAVFFRCRDSRRYYRAPLAAAIAAFYVGGLSSFTVVAVGCLFVVFLSLLRDEAYENRA